MYKPVLPALLLCSSMVLAEPARLDHNHALHMRQQGEIVPAQHLLDQALAQFPRSRLLEMKLKHKQQGYVYKLQLLDAGGKVHKLYFDAQSGELLRHKNKGTPD